jgi:hypothetical protein
MPPVQMVSTSANDWINRLTYRENLLKVLILYLKDGIPDLALIYPVEAGGEDAKTRD